MMILLGKIEKTTIAIVMVGLALAAVESKECGPKEKKCFHLQKEALSWPKALADCTKLGGTLARVDGQNDVIHNIKMLITNQDLERDDFWIGGLCEGKCKARNSADCFWITNAEQVTNNYWQNGDNDHYWQNGDTDNSEYAYGTELKGEVDLACYNGEVLNGILLRRDRLHVGGLLTEHMYICESCDVRGNGTEAPTTSTYCITQSS